MSKHTELIDAVNDAKTQYERDIAEARLAGWREGVEHWSGIFADIHTMEKHGRDRPMCCGVLLDWQPAEHAV